MTTLRMGMVGGGPGAFIGDVHRRAACLDGDVELVAGAFSASPSKSRRKGRELGLSRARTYDSYLDMVERERALPEDQQIDFVSVVTPNHLHCPVATAFLEAGFHVVCDKPMTLDVPEARRLKQVVTRSRRVFALTHNYTGYPMVKLARDLVRQGDLGRLRKVVVQYPQGWLSTRLEQAGLKQAEWRTDPTRSGAAGCIGDIGTHAENLAEYITGLQIVELCADLTTFVRGRRLDDDGTVLLRLQRGVRGVLLASQIAVGEENGLAIRVYGEEKGLEWHQEPPEHAHPQVAGRAARGLEPRTRLRRGPEPRRRQSHPAARGTPRGVSGSVCERLSETPQTPSAHVAPGRGPTRSRATFQPWTTVSGGWCSSRPSSRAHARRESG